MKIAIGQNIQKDCFLFKNGNCWRGRFCKFLHRYAEHDQLNMNAPHVGNFQIQNGAQGT